MKIVYTLDIYSLYSPQEMCWFTQGGKLWVTKLLSVFWTKRFPRKWSRTIVAKVCRFCGNLSVPRLFIGILSRSSPITIGATWSFTKTLSLWLSWSVLLRWSLPIKEKSMFTRSPPSPAIRSTKNSCGSSLNSTTILNFWREMNSESSSTKPRTTRIALHCGSMISRMISRRKTINQQLMQKAPSKGGAFCYGKNYQHNTFF